MPTVDGHRARLGREHGGDRTAESDRCLDPRPAVTAVVPVGDPAGLGPCARTEAGSTVVTAPPRGRGVRPIFACAGPPGPA
ncbi:hypothetical protein AMK33_21570 [Streptomyces sp. CB02400]|nr:hypothetical protein AMK33_21570 [Streptomyces sp. CB02400]